MRFLPGQIPEPLSSGNLLNQRLVGSGGGRLPLLTICLDDIQFIRLETELLHLWLLSWYPASFHPLLSPTTKLDETFHSLPYP